MKSIISTLTFFFAITASVFAKPLPVITIAYSSSKTVEVVANFTAHRQGDAAILNWNVLSDEATSFKIERSYDNEWWEGIADVTPEATHWNRYTDNTVEPGLIYYRIAAYLDDFRIETSATELVKIVKHK